MTTFSEHRTSTRRVWIPFHPFDPRHYETRTTLFLLCLRRNRIGTVLTLCYVSMWILILPESFDLFLDPGCFTGGRSMLPLLLQLTDGSLRKWLMDLLAWLRLRLASKHVLDARERTATVGALLGISFLMRWWRGGTRGWWRWWRGARPEHTHIVHKRRSRDDVGGPNQYIPVVRRRRLVGAPNLTICHASCNKDDQSALGFIPAALVVKGWLSGSQRSDRLAGLNRLELFRRQCVGVLIPVNCVIHNALFGKKSNPVLERTWHFNGADSIGHDESLHQ